MFVNETVRVFQTQVSARSAAQVAFAKARIFLSEHETDRYAELDTRKTCLAESEHAENVALYVAQNASCLTHPPYFVAGKPAISDLR